MLAYLAYLEFCMSNEHRILSQAHCYTVYSSIHIYIVDIKVHSFNHYSSLINGRVVPPYTRTLNTHMLSAVESDDSKLLIVHYANGL